LRKIGEAREGETQVLYGKLASATGRRLRNGRTLVEARLIDESGAIDLVWFNQPYLLEWLRPGRRVFVYGKVKVRSGVLQMAAPEFELDTDAEDSTGGASPHMQRIVPVYALTRGIQQRFLRGLVLGLLEELQEDHEGTDGPYEFFHPRCDSAIEAFRSFHFPREWDDIKQARSRFVFEEYFAFASHLFCRRQACCINRGIAFKVHSDLDQKIRSIFPFRFTPEQDEAVAAITADLRGTVPMYRLLQGDVGTGKTAVALYAMLVAVRNGCQAALMAPTEVLAEQHHRTISKALSSYPVRVALLTGSVRGAERRRVTADIEAGAAHITVGTHALVQESVTFKKLGVAVIDEQHRFGVRERMRLRTKASHPHVLVMTATPIPRSLCLTCYGDLDLSLIRERPQGRKPVTTRLVRQRERPRAMEFISKELARGRQAYFIYPLIEESETLALPAAVKAYEYLRKDVFPDYSVGLVHGKLAAAEKDAELERFRRGEHQVLVATVVVEVGIDVPNATILFIEDASRFGLAQLHQLRGRVGRGVHPGYCLVGLESSSADVRKRLGIFASTEDGFRIAAEDLKLRGPGDYLGVRQSGRPHFLLGNPLEHLDEFLRVKALADEFWKHPENRVYRQKWRDWIEPEAETAPGEGGFLGMD
jgi:ATP-dependent DNA helicase RecG